MKAERKARLLPTIVGGEHTSPSLLSVVVTTLPIRYSAEVCPPPSLPHTTPQHRTKRKQAEQQQKKKTEGGRDNVARMDHVALPANPRTVLKAGSPPPLLLFPSFDVVVLASLCHDNPLFFFILALRFHQRR
jgi:hypothetical protein